MKLYKQEQVAEQLEKYKIILKKGPNYPDGFRLKSGKISDIYINLRDLPKNPAAFNYIIYCLRKLMNNTYDKRNACMLGVPTMGAVISPVVAYHLSMPQAIIRQRKKDHGVGHNIEGYLTNKIAIVDDVITTGSSIKEVIESFIKPKFGNDYEIDVFVVVDRQEHNMSNVHSVITLDQIRK